MKKRILLLLLISAIILCPVYASVYIEQPIEKHIEKAQLIVKGIVSKTSSKKEEYLLKQFTMSNGVISEDRISVNGIYTTFTVEIDEVLYGSHDKKTIEIKMLGGCDDEGVCLRLSSNYDYEINNNVLLFLNYDDVNNFFQSSENGITAFFVHKNGQLDRAADLVAYKRNNSIIKEVQNEKSLSLVQLKEKIKEFRNEK